jgi:hypothetical protein
VAVEIILDDWIPRKIVADPVYLSKAPELLRAFVRFCHAERGIRTELTRDTLAAVDVYEPDYQRTIRSPRLQGPMALLAAMLLVRSIKGPLAGLGEIELPALQPGSSIMPGKVNPVIPEATVMVCAQVIGHHTAITVAGQTGNFQLNVTLPLIAANLLDSITLLGNVSRLLADSAIAGLSVRQAHIRETLDRNPILVTALNPVIGYEKGAAIAKQAYKQNRPVLEVAMEVTGLPQKTLKGLLDPALLAKGGIHGKPGGGAG